MRTAFYTGIVLLLLSAWPLAMMVMELLAGQYVGMRYQMTFSDGADLTFGAHKIRVERATVPPRITIDGKDYTSATANSACLVAIVSDRWASQEFLTITQAEPRGYYRNLHYRILRIPEGQPIQEEIFHRDKRIPIYRGMLIRQIHPSPSGYYSDVLSGWPSLLFPVLYPWVSGGIGLLLALIGGLVLRRRKCLAKLREPLPAS